MSPNGILLFIHTHNFPTRRQLSICNTDGEFSGKSGDRKNADRQSDYELVRLFLRNCSVSISFETLLTCTFMKLLYRFLHDSNIFDDKTYNFN